MFIKYIKPSGILAEFIHYYWVLEIEASEGEVGERVIPTGNIQMMFHYKNPFLCTSAKEHIVQPRTFMSGLSCEWADAIACGDSGVIGVVFFPSGTCNFFDFPLCHLENSTVSLYDIDGGKANLVEDKINSASSLKERVAAVEDYLFSRLKPIDAIGLRLIKNIVGRILQKRGQVTAADLSKMLFLSEKSLERKCSSFIGISPKQFIRIVRFQETIKGLAHADKKLLTEASCENGFFDQAHFIKDFKALSGYTPREFLRRYPCPSFRLSDA
jgi:AraC-like DNA-binding protein